MSDAHGRPAEAASAAAPGDREELRAQLAALLDLEPSEVADTDNLIALGLTSVTAMRLVTGWRRAGLPVTFAELTEQPTLGAWWQALRPAATPAAGAPAPAAPVPAVPAPSPEGGETGEPFPLTAVQRAYWLGRKDGMPLGGVGCHAYCEFDGAGVDPARLAAAARQLVARHAMLRGQVLHDGRQRIRPQPDWPGPTVHDLRDETTAGGAAKAAEAIREQLSHRRLDVEAGEMFDLRLTLLPGGATRLHLNLDLIAADVLSLQILLADLAALYDGRALPPITTAIAPHLAGPDAAEAARARAHWAARLADLPAGGPRLPLAVDPAALGRAPRFTRRLHRLPAAAWQRLAERGRRRGLTPSMTLATAFAETLGRWSDRSRFLLNVPLFDRHGDHPELARLVADFTGLMLLEADTGPMEGEDTFTARAARLQRRFQLDAGHSAHSAVEVLRDLGRLRGEPPAAAPVVFASSLGGEFLDPAFRERFGPLGWMVTQTPQVWLDHQLYEMAGELLLTWDSVDALFPAGLVDDMFAAYTGAVDALARAGDAAAWDRPLPADLPPRQARVRDRANDTAAPVPGGLLHDAVIRQCRDTPDRTAVVDGEGPVTYGELLRHAQAVRDLLHGHGCRPGVPVAVALPKGRHQVAAVLGTLLAGCPYLPLDTAQPRARRDRILADAGVRHVLAPAAEAARSRPADPGRPWPAAVQVLGCDPAAPHAAPAPPPAGPAAPGDLAYIIYTSGSTGTPKGVMISHRAALNTVADVTGRYQVGPDDRVLGLAGLGFDLSVYDIFGPLSVGAALVLPDPERRGDPSHWARTAAVHRVTVWNSVPAQLQALERYLGHDPDHDLSALRLALLSGDWLPVGLPDAIRGRIPGLRVVSLGGATEAAIWSIAHPVGEVDTRRPSIPYGRPLANQTFHVLDAQMRDRPDWVPGELYIGGEGLAVGYLGDAARTAERFPTHPVTGRRLYRTGDLGRYRPDGVIEFLGRADAQLKIRGHRVEPGEVEAALAAHPQVGACRVIADTTGGDRRLAAFATPAPLPAGAAPAGEDAGWAAARGAYRRLARAADPAALRRSSDLLRAAVHASLAHLLTECGVFAAGDVREEDEVLAALGAAPEHRPLARRWLAALADAGRLRRLPGARWEGLRTADAADAERAWDAAVEGTVADLWPREVVELFRSAAGQLPALVRGEQQAAQLLFPQGDSRTARAAFGGSLAVRALNGAVGAFVRAEARSRAGTGRPLRVLEVGAGVGATTDEVIAALDGTGTGPAADAGTAPYVEYVYTDVSLFFLNAAQERHAHLPWITHTVFDIDADYRAQGFEPNTFDVILGANVLHNARDLGRCLARMRGLLAPGGALVLTEATRERPELMVSMDFLIGAQLGGEGFADDRAGSGGALLDAGQWRERLAAAGGVAPPALPESAADPLAGSGMALVAARFKPRLAAPDPGELLDHLAEQVPAYMVPAHLQVVDELPLTANGKVDTAMLRSWLPRSAPARSSGWVPPRGPLEERIAEVWAALLGSERVGRDDDFFHSGGDSLLAARFAARLRETLPAAAARPFDAVLRQLTAGPTVAALAAWLALGAEDAQEAQDGQGAR